MEKNRYGFLNLLKQRRFWAAVASGSTALCVGMGWSLAAQFLTVGAGLLAGHSYILPKK